MQEVKTCKLCGVVISDLNCSDYYSHIRKKYCSDCAKSVRRKQQAEYQQRRRTRAGLEKWKKKLDDDNYLRNIHIEYRYKVEQLELLKEENALLRERIRQLEMEKEK